VTHADARPPSLVVHVIHRFGVGGLENGIVNLVNRMPQERWRHAIVSLTDVAPGFAARIHRADVDFIALDKRPGHLVRDYPRLFRLFRTLRPEIVHTRNLAALEAVVPAWAARVPVRIHGEHGWDMHDPHGKSARYRFVRRLYRPFVTRYVALSRHLEDYLEHQVGTPAARVSQVYNGVDTERFRPFAVSRPPIRDCPFGDPTLWLVGSVGRMEAVKDPCNLAHAFIRANALHPEATRHWRLVMVGDGGLRGAIEKSLADHGLRDRVWLPGERADVAEILRGLDCFVLPSLAEGISNTILEALATGLPVVATAVGGNGELIESGTNGTLVPAADPVALARAMLDYYNDHATAKRHGKVARRVVEQKFSLDRMVADYVAIYERALSRNDLRDEPRDASRAGVVVGTATHGTRIGG
jgi:sugar transferase (PEP-CTERM/EpsH1 system associated)